MAMQTKRIIKNKRSFDEWFEVSYNELKERCRLTSNYDEDAFHEAYIRTVTDNNLCISTEDYVKTFLSAYRKLCRSAFSDTYDTIRPDETFFSMLPDTQDERDYEEENKRDTLATIIKKFIIATFTPMQVACWNLRLSGYSLRNTADACGLNSEREVKNTIDTIRTTTSERFTLAVI